LTARLRDEFSRGLGRIRPSFIPNADIAATSAIRERISLRSATFGH